LEIVEGDVPDPDTLQVRIKVQACGIYHGDSTTLRVLRHAGSYACVHDLQYD
jgi:Zn-dependent alcohol dehydrogenase